MPGGRKGIPAGEGMGYRTPHKNRAGNASGGGGGGDDEATPPTPPWLPLPPPPTPSRSRDPTGPSTSAPQPPPRAADNIAVVHFRLLDKPTEDDFSLELSKRSTYDDVVEKVAHHLGLDDPPKLCLTQHNPYSMQPKPQYIKYRGLDHLLDMLHHVNQTFDILCYEILDIPLPELQGLITLRVAFYHATSSEVQFHIIRLPKGNTFSDLTEDVKSKVELSRSDAELWLFQLHNNKIWKVYQPDGKIDSVNDLHGPLHVEEVLHNMAMESFLDSCPDAEKLTEILGNVKKRSDVLASASREQADSANGLGNNTNEPRRSVISPLISASHNATAYGDEFDTTIKTFNTAFILYHLHDYESALSALESLYRKIEPIDECTENMKNANMFQSPGTPIYTSNGSMNRNKMDAKQFEEVHRLVDSRSKSRGYFEFLYALHACVLSLDLTMVHDEFSCRAIIGRPLTQTVDDTCAIVSGVKCLEVQHRRAYEGWYGAGTFSCHAAAPRKIRKACLQKKKWSPKNGAYVGDVLEVIKDLGGARTTTEVSPAPSFLQLKSWQMYKWDTGIGLSADTVVWLLETHGPFVGSIWVSPWYHLFDRREDNNKVYKSGCARSPRLQEMSLHMFRELVGRHSVLVFEYRWLDDDLHVCVQDNHDPTTGPERWLHFAELEDAQTISVERLERFHD